LSGHGYRYSELSDLKSTSGLLKNVWLAAWGHAAYKISSEIGMPCRPGALTGRLFQQAPSGNTSLRFKNRAHLLQIWFVRTVASHEIKLASLRRCLGALVIKACSDAAIGMRRAVWRAAGRTRATAWRKMVAHGANRGSSVFTRISPGGATHNGPTLTPNFLPPLAGLVAGYLLYPRLTSWAVVWRRSAACSPGQMAALECRRSEQKR